MHIQQQVTTQIPTAPAYTETVQNWEKGEWGLARAAEGVASGDVGSMLSAPGQYAAWSNYDAFEHSKWFLPIKKLQSLKLPTLNQLTWSMNCSLWKTVYNALWQEMCCILYLVLKSAKHCWKRWQKSVQVTWLWQGAGVGAGIKLKQAHKREVEERSHFFLTKLMPFTLLDIVFLLV